ncbi:PPC domain-containing protein [Hyalangium versicolor]|uniref:PPC domain-containing protein n=1 Tax=Hyalangium versicolor TaxID=2861190 RepID=UPI001CCC1761|nr:PPC domain-containing protein [Hyalangium versicolor]
MKREFSPRLLALTLSLFVVTLSGCPGEEPPVSDPCEGIVCGLGRCVASDGQATCECDRGYHADGLTCVKDNEPPPNPCEPNPCVQPGRGQCSSVNGGAVCSCDPGKQEEDGVCVTPHPCEPNPCTTPNKTDCSVSNGQPVCSCVSGYVPEGEECRPEQPVTCSGQHSTGDSFEPDECPALARAVGAGGTQNEEHTLSPSADEDWFKLTAVAGHVYEAVATGVAGERLHLDLYAEDGSTVLASDHSGQATARLVHKAAGAGALFFRIRAFSSGETGTYRISLTDLGADDFADEPALATALTAPNGTPVSGSLQFDGDRDVVKVPLTAGHSYRFEAAWSAASTAALRLELIAPEQTTVRVSSEQVAPKLLTRITSAGDYYLRIQEPTGKLRASYTFTVTDLGVDDHGDAPPEASPVVIDGPPASGGSEQPDDIDIFTFQAQAGHIYAFTCNPSGGAVDCQVSLSDVGGNVLATDNNGGTGYIVYEYTQAGTYYFRISLGAVGSYTYRLEDLGVDNHGDTIDTATPINAGGGVSNGSLEQMGDVDVFSFTATAGHIYRFTCGSSVLDCDVELLDSTGAILVSATGPETPAVITYEFNTGGAYFFRVQTDGSATGAYTYSLEDLGVDDHGDDLANATALTAGAPVATGTLELSGDVDVFSFSATAEHLYEFSCTATTIDCDVELLDATGTVLTADHSSNTSAVVRRQLITAGTYYVRVKGGNAASATGTYGYRLQDLGVDDHGNTDATATPISVMASGATGKIEIAGDTDVFSFSATAGHIYEFTCTAAAGDCDLFLADSSGTVLRQDVTSSFSAKILYEVGAAGTYYVRLKFGAASSTVIGGYTYQLRDLGVDDHGDTEATATPISVMASGATGLIETKGDYDVFSFSATAGHIYEFSCTAAAGDCDLALVDSSGTVLRQDVTSSFSAKILYEVGAAGTYYVRLWFGDASTTVVGGYTYQLKDQGVDDHGDTDATATPISVMASGATGLIETKGDYDVFSFSATAGHIYEFSCTAAAGDCDLFLADSSGTVLRQDVTSSFSAKILYEIGAAGTYYVRLKFGDGSTTVVGGYTYQLKDQGVDDHGDTQATATPIVPSTTSTLANFEIPGDTDVFSFTAEAGHIYQFTCVPASSSLDCNAYLRDAAGTTLASSTSTSSSATVRYEVATPGTYYLVATVYTWESSNFSYRFQLQDLGLDDYGDTRATAAPIVPSATATPALLELASDEDWFSFTAVAGQAFDFFCTTSNFDCNLGLYNAAGTLLTSDTSSSNSAQVTRKFPTAGTYYVRVYAGSGSGAYSFRLNDRGVDDHSDTFTGATTLTLGTALAGTIEISGDADFFAVSLAASTSYTVTTTGISTTITVYAPDMTTTISSGSSPRSFTSTAAGGVHFVRVQAASATGAYTVKVQ